MGNKMEATTRLRKKARDKRRSEEKQIMDNRTDYDKCIKFMSFDEMKEFTILLYSGGMHDAGSNTHFVGSEQYNKIEEFKFNIVNKYKSMI